MKRLASGVLAVMVCVFAMMATEKRAYAYVDPGVGFLVLQSIASVAAAVGYFFRRKFKALFGGSARVETVKAVTPARATKRETRRLA
jgi:hypothetical protein